MNAADDPRIEAITADERARSAEDHGEGTRPLPVGVAALREQIERLDVQAVVAARRGEQENAKATRQMAEKARARLKVYQTLWDRETAKL
jgi:hypothetical protein